MSHYESVSCNSIAKRKIFVTLAALETAMVQQSFKKLKVFIFDLQLSLEKSIKQYANVDKTMWNNNGVERNLLQWKHLGQELGAGAARRTVSYLLAAAGPHPRPLTNSALSRKVSHLSLPLHYRPIKTILLQRRRLFGLSLLLSASGPTLELCDRMAVALQPLCSTICLLNMAHGRSSPNALMQALFHSDHCEAELVNSNRPVRV